MYDLIEPFILGWGFISFQHRLQDFPGNKLPWTIQTFLPDFLRWNRKYHRDLFPFLGNLR
jgi:hypothetical protein